MKKALLYALTLAFVLSLAACSQPKAEQPTDPAPSTSAPEPIATPEPIKDTIPETAPEQTPEAPVETEDTQPPEETESEEVESPVEEVQLFTDCNETVYATGTVNIRESYTADSNKLGSLSAGQSIARTGTSIAGTEAEGWSRVELSDGTVAYISSKYLSTTKPAPQQQQQQQTSKPSSGTTTQQQQQPQQPSEPQGGGGDSAADIEARKQAFLNGMNQMFEDNGYSTSGEDHNWTEEEKQALINSVGGVVGG
ncbi:MAG: SH3 domain-containing protein [Oscillibacter sp.]|jgi:uncharacterized protein YgiM (DUF1202 family)|nr:SH3 domain-containing protein [Oscillibacter sp.]